LILYSLRVNRDDQRGVVVPNAYSVDVRRKVVEACARGDRTQRQVARDFGIGIASVVRFVIRARQGKLAYERARTVPSRRRLDEAGELRLLALARDTPDATGPELVDALFSEGLRVSRSTVDRILQRHGFTRKKRRSSPSSAAPAG
jgi:transposase